MSTISPRDRNITVIVQANQLYNDPNSQSEEVVDRYTSLVEDGGLGNGFGDPNKDFETIVFMNKNIYWSIKTNDPNGVDKNYSVYLSKVFHNPTPGNPNFFNDETLEVNRNTGKVCGTITKNPNLPEKDDSYTIQFSVGFSEPNRTGIKLVNLDPKIKINPGN